MSKRSVSVGILTAGLSVGLAAAAISPAAAQGNPVGGQGNIYFMQGAVNSTGVAQQIKYFGDPSDEVYYGDWYNSGTDLPMVRRGNLFFVPSQSSNATANVFGYGDKGDVVLVGDWDGDGFDTIAVRRGNQYFIKNDNTKTGPADSTFYYGEVSDTVLVGNWDGNKTPVLPGPDGKLGTLDDIAAVVGDGDSLMVKRGSQFFVSNSLATGVAAYSFYYGDPTDTILVGDWATPGTNDLPSTINKDEWTAPKNGNGADQLAVRRGGMYFQSTELEQANIDKSNPTALRSFAYGDPTDTVFVAALPSLYKGQASITDPAGAPTINVTPVAGQPSGLVYDANGAPYIDGYTAGTPATNTDIVPLVNGATPVVAYDRTGKAHTIAAAGAFVDPAPAAGKTNYLFDSSGNPYLALTATNTVRLTATDFALAGNQYTVPANATIQLFDRGGSVVLEATASFTVTGDGMGVRRAP